MSAPEPRVPTSRLRAAVAAAVERTSFREVAREVGISPMGIHRLLQGSEPQQRTRLKLEAWFVRHSEAARGEVDATTAAAALSILLHDLPPDRRDYVFHEALRFWRSMYRSGRGELPEWLTSLQARGPTGG